MMNYENPDHDGNPGFNQQERAMGDETSIDWHAGLIEAGREHVENSMREDEYRISRPWRRCVHGRLFTESCRGCGYVHPRDR